MDAVPDDVAESQRLAHFFLQVHVLELQMRPQSLDFLERPGVDHRPGDFVRKDAQPDRALFRGGDAGENREHAENLVLELDRLDVQAANMLMGGPLVTRQPRGSPAKSFTTIASPLAPTRPIFPTPSGMREYSPSMPRPVRPVLRLPEPSGGYQVQARGPVRAPRSHVARVHIDRRAPSAKYGPGLRGIAPPARSPPAGAVRPRAGSAPAPEDDPLRNRIPACNQHAKTSTLLYNKSASSGNLLTV